MRKPIFRISVCLVWAFLNLVLRLNATGAGGKTASTTKSTQRSSFNHMTPGLFDTSGNQLITDSSDRVRVWTIAHDPLGYGAGD